MFWLEVAAIIHYFIALLKLTRISPVVINAGGGTYKNLHQIWFTRFLKRIISALLRTPLRYSATKLLTVDFNNKVSKNSVIVCCHTPWARLIASWCDQNKYSMIIGGRVWEKRVGIANHVDDHAQIKELINYLQTGGRVIIMADVFNKGNDCPVKFMGKEYNASAFPLRLARKAQSKLITVLPQLKNDSVQINFGPEPDINNTSISLPVIIQDLLSYFEEQIKKDPSVWLRFIRSSYPDKELNEQTGKGFSNNQVDLLSVERSTSLR